MKNRKTRATYLGRTSLTLTDYSTFLKIPLTTLTSARRRGNRTAQLTRSERCLLNEGLQNLDDTAIKAELADFLRDEDLDHPEWLRNQIGILEYELARAEEHHEALCKQAERHLATESVMQYIVEHANLDDRDEEEQYIWARYHHRQAETARMLKLLKHLKRSRKKLFMMRAELAQCKVCLANAIQYEAAQAEKAAKMAEATLPTVEASPNQSEAAAVVMTTPAEPPTEPTPGILAPTRLPNRSAAVPLREAIAILWAQHTQTKLPTGQALVPTPPGYRHAITDSLMGLLAEALPDIAEQAKP